MPAFVPLPDCAVETLKEFDAMTPTQLEHIAAHALHSAANLDKTSCKNMVSRIMHLHREHEFTGIDICRRLNPPRYGETAA